ncbi:MAG: long-chain fatty acid--CoA ligase [Phyllobacteriaceae bacterium]|nr:long-chain fatty acid--CoA ligase [Phyllobacteriaceae bacterium]MBA89176.1 long-chain fatty acid--CoA ligase [Phyllobacteriaceae bacterium]
MNPSSDIATMTMPQVLRKRAGEHGSELALREKKLGRWVRFTWQDYYEQARLTAIGLSALGFGPGDRIAVAGEDTPQWLFADLGAQMAGGACLGVYPTNPWPELQYIVRHSRARIVVCGDQEQTDKVIEARRREGGLPDVTHIIAIDMKGMRQYDEPGLMSFDDLIALGRQREAELGALIDRQIDSGKADDVAIIVYTSGTTGMPKGAMLTHGNMLHSASRMAAIHKLDRQNYSVLCYLPLCHVAERSFSTVMQLVTGCTVSFAESVDTVVVNLREIAPRGFLGVPRIWEKMLQAVLYRVKDTTPFQRRVYDYCMARGRPIAERRLANGGRFASTADALTYRFLSLICFRNLRTFLGLDRVQTGFCGGATVSPEVLLFFWIIGVPVYQIYGMTECAGASHSQRPGATSLGTSGLVIEGVEQKLAEDGELLLAGASVFKGYLFDEEATRRALEGGWLHTGDIVAFDDSGEARVLDRKKDILITSGGKNITPSLIENALKDSPYIREAILLGDGRNFLSALIQIDLETTGKWAQEANVQYTTYRSLAENPDVRDLIDAEVRKVNERFARVENIRKFVILTKELDHDDGELTATMKVRRKIIEEKFEPEIRSIYGDAA